MTTELRAVRDVPGAGSVGTPGPGGTDEATRELSLRDSRAAVRAAEAADETAQLPVVPSTAVDETAVLPKITEEADRTAVLPRIEPGRPAPERPVSERSAPERPAPGRVEPGRAGAGRTQAGRTEDRVPPGLWREEPVDSTRELPVVGDEPQPADESQATAERPRPEWAEETPMDDLPSLTDTLLGSRDEWSRWNHGGPAPQDPRGGQDRPVPGGDQGEGGGKGKGRRWGRRG